MNHICYDIGIELYCTVPEWPVNGLTHMPDVLPPVHSTEDWQAAFGFPPGQDDQDEIVSSYIFFIRILFT